MRSGWLIRIGEVFTGPLAACAAILWRLSLWRRFHFYLARLLAASDGLLWEEFPAGIPEAVFASQKV